ncbi:hypothetical protein ACFV5N_09345 [Streptomyces sp. NPDC059853]
MDCEDCGTSECHECRIHYCLDVCPCGRSHTCDCQCSAHDRMLTDAD